MTRSTLLISALLITLTAACGGDEPAESRAGTAPSASRADGAAREFDGIRRDMAEIDDYRLSMEAVERWHRAQRGVYRRARGNPALAQQLHDLDMSYDSLDEMEDRLSSMPLFDESIEDAGLEPREFALITFALFQATAAQTAIEEGVSRDSVLAQISFHPDNLEFVRQHRARLQRMEEETEAMAPPEPDYGEEY